MLDWVKSLFGKGKIRVEFTTTNGRAGSLKIDYVGDPATLDEYELREKCRQILLVEHGLYMDTFKLVGITTS